MPTYDNTDRGAYVALGAIFGIAAGIGAGMLLAPRSGEETRRQFKDRADEARSRAHKQFATTRSAATEKLSQALDKSKDAVDKTATATKESIDTTKAKTTTRSRRASK